MNYAQLLVPDFSLILCGYLVCRYTALNRRVWEQVDNLVYFLLFPVLLFNSIMRSPVHIGEASHLLAAAFIASAIGIALALLLPYIPGLKTYMPLRLHAASAQVGFRFNSFVAIALIERLAGPQGSLLIALLIGIFVPLFNAISVWSMARHTNRGLLGEIMRNPLIVSTACALSANLMGLSVPTWIEPTLSRMGAAALALGLMAAGAGMRLGALAQAKTLAVAVLSIRHGVAPVLAAVMASVFALDPTQAMVLLAFAAMPTAATCYVLAARMGYDGEYVGSLVTLSTLLGMLSLSVALGVLLPLVLA
jgi:predicted permease